MTRAASVAVCVAALAWGRVTLGAPASPAASAAPSAGGPALVVVHGSDDAPASDDAAIQRLAAELTLLGLRVRLDAASAPEPASARIRLEAARGKVEILFFDVATGTTTLRQQLDAPPAPDTAALLVVRTVELVRAVLLPPPVAEARPAAAAPITQVAVEAAPPATTSPRLAVTLGAGALATGGEVGGAAMLAFAARARVAGPFGLELLALAPLTRAETTTPEGRGQLATWVAGGGVFAGTSRGRLAFDAALGALALWLRTDGTPATGFVETQDSTVGAAAHARLGAAWALGPQLAARVDVLGGALLRRPVLAFPDSTSRPAWSRAFAGAILAVEARF